MNQLPAAKLQRIFGMCKLLRTKFLKIIQNYSGTPAGLLEQPQASGTRASQYASFTHGAETAETSGGTIPHKRVFSFKQRIR